MNIETSFTKLDVPMTPRAFIFCWWGWSEYLENLKKSQALKQDAGDIAVSWIMGSMVGGK